MFYTVKAQIRPFLSKKQCIATRLFFRNGGSKKEVFFHRLRAVSLENVNLEAILISKIRAIEISRKSNGNLKFSHKNGNLEK